MALRRRTRKGDTTCDYFTTLPIELHVQILGFLPCFTTVFSAVCTHSSIFSAFKASERQILLAVFHRHCNRAKAYDVGQVFWELVFAIRQDFVARDIAQELFTVGWQLFRDRGLEELLLPLGRALAWSYCLDGPEGSAGREEEAVALLTKLAHGDAPFDHKPQPASKGAIFRRDFKQPWPKVTLWPVLALLESLTGLSLDLIDRNTRVNFWRTRLCEKICVVEIENKTVRVFPMECEAYHTLGMLGPDGIRFNDGRALLGLVCPGRRPFQYSPVQWNAPVNRSKSTLWTRSPRHAFRKSKIARLQMNSRTGQNQPPGSIQRGPTALFYSQREP